MKPVAKHLLFPAIVCLAALLSGCGGGGGSGGSANTGGGSGNGSLVPSENDTSAAFHCENGAKTRLGEYMVEANEWNPGSVTGYQECIKISSGGSGVTASWTWNWPASGAGAIHAYPEVIFGQKPWYSNSTTASLPRQINALKNVNVSFTATTTGVKSTDKGNLAFDIWITNSNQIPSGQSNLPLNTELMIWLDAWNDQPEGDLIGTVTIGGVNWALYSTYATPWGPSNWHYVAYVAQGAIAQPYNIDVTAFLNDMQRRKWLGGYEWLASVELGNELSAGSGTTTIGNFTVQVQ